MLRVGRVRGEAFRDDDYRISGQAETTVRVDAALSGLSPATRGGSVRRGEAVDDAGRGRGGRGARQRGAQDARRTPSVEAAIFSTSVSTGVASSLTPLA